MEADLLEDAKDLINNIVDTAQQLKPADDRQNRKCVIRGLNGTNVACTMAIFC